MASLTHNAISTMMADNNRPDQPRPILQVLDIRKIGQQNGNSAERYRVVLSDGQFLQQAMLATQLNELITSQQLEIFSIVRVDDWMVNQVQNRKCASLRFRSPPARCANEF